MAYQFKKFNYMSGADTWFQWKAFMKLQGWTVAASSDGINTPNTDGTVDKITHNGSGAGGMANNYAWFVLRMPNTTRSVLVQKYWNSDDRYWIVKYSWTGFLTGSPTATNAPTGAGEIFVHNTNDLVNYAGRIFFDNSRGGLRVLMCADNAAPYGFWFVAYSQLPYWNDNTYQGPLTCGGLMLDPLVAGSYTAGSKAINDPYVINRADDDLRKFLRTESIISGGLNYYSGLPITAYQDYAGPNAGMLLQALTFLHGVRELAFDPLSQKDLVLPVYYYRPTGWGYPILEGESSFLKYTAPLRFTGDLITTAAASAIGQSYDRIVVGHCSLPWDGSLPNQGG